MAPTWGWGTPGFQPFSLGYLLSVYYVFTILRISGDRFLESTTLLSVLSAQHISTIAWRSPKQWKMLLVTMSEAAVLVSLHKVIKRSTPAPSTPVLGLLGVSLKPVQLTRMAGCHLPLFWWFFPFFSSKIVFCHFSNLKSLTEWSSRHRVKQQKDDFSFWQLWTHHKPKEWFATWRLGHFSKVGNVNLNSSFFKPRQDLRSCWPLKMRLITEHQQESPGSISWCIPEPPHDFMECHNMAREARMKHLPVVPMRRKADSHLMQSYLVRETV